MKYQIKLVVLLLLCFVISSSLAQIDRKFMGNLHLSYSGSQYNSGLGDFKTKGGHYFLSISPRLGYQIKGNNFIGLGGRLFVNIEDNVDEDPVNDRNWTGTAFYRYQKVIYGDFYGFTQLEASLTLDKDKENNGIEQKQSNSLGTSLNLHVGAFYLIKRWLSVEIGLNVGGLSYSRYKRETQMNDLKYTQIRNNFSLMRASDLVTGINFYF